MLTQEQVKARRNYIGGGDAAPILGLSRWDTQLGVWAIKTGRVDPEDISDKLAVILGNKLEDTVAELFTEATGKKVHRVNETKFHVEHSFIGANIDRRVVGEDAILECKTCSAWKAKEWAGEEIPQEYILQVVHYLAVTGSKYGYIAVLIGNQEFKWQMITRDDDMIRDLIAKEVKFWNEFVVPNVMPMTIQASDSDVLYSLFPVADPNAALVLDDDASAILERLEASCAELSLLEKDVEKYKNELKAMLGESETAQAGQYKISWKNQESKRIEIETLKFNHPEVYNSCLKVSKSRVFRYSKKEIK